MGLLLPFKSDRKMHGTVRELSAHGFTAKDIAAFTGAELSEEEFKQSFSQAFDRGAIQANLDVAKALYEMATSGKCAAATTFWLRCRAGWTVQTKNEFGDEDVEMVFGPYPETED